MKEFLRRDCNRHSKLGKKKKKKWRRPAGRHNKMREKRKGYPSVISVGYKADKKIRGNFGKNKLVLVRNIKDLKKIQKNGVGIIGAIGKKKKIELAKMAEEMKIRLYNINTKKFLNENAEIKKTEKIQEKSGEDKK